MRVSTEITNNSKLELENSQNYKKVVYLYNGPVPPNPLKKEEEIFYVNNDISCVEYNMKNPENWNYIDHWVSRLRKIINNRSTFRSEDIDIIRWNSDLFPKKPISGSTYVLDGNLQVFLDSVTDIENKVLSFRK